MLTSQFKCLLIVVFLFNYNVAFSQYMAFGEKNIPYESVLSNQKISSIQLAPHPRLFFSRSEEAAILKKAASNTLLSELIEVLKQEADKELLEVPQIYIPNTQLLKVSRTQIGRVLTLSMAYRFFKQEKYAKKVEEELLNVCRFPSWNPVHFLDVAEMTTAVAIGYDWCYDYLSPSSRKLIEDAIRKKGFAPAWPIYKDTSKTPFNRENNWNIVCNAGMLNGAIAIGDKYPDELQQILDYAVQYTPHLLESFAPEGVFNEGPGYWAYNGMYMALFFDNLNRNIRNNFKLVDFKGLSNTANFYMNIVGPSNKTFNFGDASTNVDHSGTFFFLSKQYNKPQVAEFYRGLLRSALNEYKSSGEFTFPRFFFLCIPWFDESIVSEAESENKLETFEGVTDFIIMNGNSKSDKNRLYLAAKTGRGNWSHNQLDVGSFVVDSEGERWGIDIGADNYSLSKFWDYKPGGVRWNYFRNTNLAHNTITIDHQITHSDGEGKLLRVKKTGNSPYGIFDISPAYKGQASSVLRGFKLLSSDIILIKDEIDTKGKTKNISWKFFTNAEVQIKGNTATLSQNGKQFYIQCLLENGFTMNVKEPKTYTPEEKPLENVRYIEISLDNPKKSTTIPVLMSKSLSQLNEWGKEGDLMLSKWK